MGLAGTKRRTKLSSDPNNTAWSKATDGFGHKILSAHGWKPGQLLGAVDANHAEHFTAANASHIRVFLREDNLGLGAQVGKSNADTFGLSTLSGIFGRLNGKSDAELEKQQSAQRDLELRSYQTRKYGSMNFVRGGILLGDKIEELVNDNASGRKPQPDATASQNPEESTTSNRKSKSSKKRRHSESERTTMQPVKAQDEEAADEEQDQLNDDASPSTTTETQHSAKELKALLKAEKRQRKEARRKQKAERVRATTDKTTTAEPSPISTPTGTSTGTSTPTFAGSRHNVRQRFIQQKRMASMDARALDEILMRKTPVC